MLLSFLKEFKELLLFDFVLSFVVLLMYFLPKKNINFLIGYRTLNAMKSKKNWMFSQHFFFKNWLYVIPLVILFQIIMIYFIGTENKKKIERYSVILFFIYTIFLIYSTERKLKKL